MSDSGGGRRLLRRRQRGRLGARRSSGHGSRWRRRRRHKGDSATLDDLRELVNMLEDSARGARRVYGTKHPFVVGTEYHIEKSRAALAARETPSPGSA